MSFINLRSTIFHFQYFLLLPVKLFALPGCPYFITFNPGLAIANPDDISPVNDTAHFIGTIPEFNHVAQ
ncbi:hypothetical protein DVR11_19070 [Paracoccus versutus]|nr:hypothetical protein DVR11_19070 [Paracoccus versutus]